MPNSNNRGNNVPMLVREIKSINLVNCMDRKKLPHLIKNILEEREKIKKRFQKNAMKDSTINKELLAKYQAEDEILIGLLYFLQEKILNFINMQDN